MPDVPLPYTLRLAQPADLAVLPGIEDAAGRRYGEVGIDPDLAGLPLSAFVEGQRDGLLCIAAAGDVPVGFALSWERPGALHLRELDVHPAHQGRGLGGQLISAVRREARRRGDAAVTLTTFSDVPWNRPYYERRGFVAMPQAAWPAWLSVICEAERASGLWRWPRLAMRCDAG